MLSNTLSPIKRSVPPLKKPNEVISQGIIFNVLDISIAGDNSDQKDAAIITPAANPNIASIKFLLTFLKKKTIDAPNRVIIHVNIVAIKACK